ncbi:hypothetical protein, partial [Herbiconiux daphne]
MKISKQFKEVGEPTDCADLDFCKAVQDMLPIWRHTSPEKMQDRMQRLFESQNRFEFHAIDDEGRTAAIMVITCDDEEAHIGEPVLIPVMACSLQPGLLTGAYRWLFQIAREYGINWIYTTKT